MICCSLNCVQSNATPKPGHMLLKYYQRAAIIKEQKSFRRELKSLCISFLHGFIPDERCKEWIDEDFNNSFQLRASWILTCIFIILIVMHDFMDFL